jgi:hypothetical protein
MILIYREYHLALITLFSEEILLFLEQKTDFFSKELPHCNTVFRFAVCCQVWMASTFFYKGVTSSVVGTTTELCSRKAL